MFYVSLDFNQNWVETDFWLSLFKCKFQSSRVLIAA